MHLNHQLVKLKHDFDKVHVICIEEDRWVVTVEREKDSKFAEITEAGIGVTPKLAMKDLIHKIENPVSLKEWFEDR